MPAPVPDTWRPSPILEPAAAPPPAAPTFWEGVSANFDAARADQLGHMDGRMDQEYGAVADALVALGHDAKSYLRPFAPDQSVIADPQAIWRDVQAEKKRGHFADLPDDLAAWQDSLRAKIVAQDDQRRAVAGRSGWGSWLVGGMGASLSDPIMAPAMLIGGGAGTGARGVIGAMGHRILRDALINGAVAAANQPLVAVERAGQGRDLTLGEAALGTLGGAAFGGAFGGAMHAAGGAIELGSSAFSRALRSQWDRLPAGLQTRLAAGTTIDGVPIDDALLADTSRALIGDVMTDAEHAAYAVVRRRGQLAASSAFAPDGVGGALHDDMLAAAFDTINRGPMGRAALRSGTAIGTGRLPISAAAGDSAVRQFLARVGVAESSMRGDARAATSSAAGYHGFLKGTWLHYYKARFGAGGLSDEAILAKRSDLATSTLLLGDLTRDHVETLHRLGQEVTPGNLYTVHFAGPAGARALFMAERGANAAAVLGERAAKANPWLERMTVDDVLRMADRKMGGTGVPRVRSDIDLTQIYDTSDPAAAKAAMQAEIDRLHADVAQRRAALGLENERVAGAATDGDPDVVPIHEGPSGEAAGDPAMPPDVVAEPAPETAPVAAPEPVVPPEVAARLEAVRSAVHDSKASLRDLPALATRLDMQVGELKAALDTMRTSGEIGGKQGRFWRLRQNRGGGRTHDSYELLNFIAEKGGLRDDEGHNLGLKSLSPEEIDQIRQQVRAGDVQAEIRSRLLAKEKKGYRNWRRMTPAGPLLRHGGRSLDQLGELLHEAGYFPLHGERPTIDDVLQMIEQRVQSKQKTYPIHDPDWLARQPLEAPTDTGSELDAMAGQIASAMHDYGLDIRDFSDQFVEAAAEIALRKGISPEAALVEHINDEFASTVESALEEGGDPVYGDFEYEPADNASAFDATDAARRAEEARFGPEGEFRPEADFGDAGEIRYAGEGDFGDPDQVGRYLAGLPEGERTAFLDPDGDAAQRQVDSLAHDAAMAAGLGESPYATEPVAPDTPLDMGEQIDPAAAERQRQEAQLRAEAPLRGENRTGQAQDGTMGMALFDAADQPGFRLDAEGPEMTIAELLAEAERLQKDIDTIDGCMVPPKTTGS